VSILNNPTVFDFVITRMKHTGALIPSADGFTLDLLGAYEPFDDGEIFSQQLFTGTLGEVVAKQRELAIALRQALSGTGLIASVRVAVTRKFNDENACIDDVLGAHWVQYVHTLYTHDADDFVCALDAAYFNKPRVSTISETV